MLTLLARLAICLLALALLGPATSAAACGPACVAPSFSSVRIFPPAGYARSWTGGRKTHRPPAPITMQVSAGYDDLYRQAAWAPVRVTVHNRTGRTISGTVETPDAPDSDGLPQQYHTVYQVAMSLPPGATRLATFYLPGRDVPGEIDVGFRSENRVLATASAAPASVDYGSGYSTLFVGAFSDDPGTIGWIRHDMNGSTAIRLTAQMLDPVPDALSSFDVIILSNLNAAALNQDQFTALNLFVREGGTLVLVGGPDWQETLRPLPPSLIPGTLAGTRTVRGLGGLRSISPQAPPSVATTISMLSHPAGDVLAQQDGVPLVVQDPMGRGQVIYLAFDPSVAPFPQWGNASSLLTQVTNRAGSQDLARPSALYTIGGPGWWGGWGPFAALDLGTELSNAPAAALPSIVLFILLTVMYVLLLGPGNFLLLRRLRRRELAWATIPATALLCVGATFGLAFHLKGNTVLINTLSVIQLDDGGTVHPQSLYLGLFAPVQGDYHLTYNGMALPAAIPNL